MSIIELPYFDKLDSTNLEDEYDIEIEFNGRTVDVFLFEMEIADKQTFAIIKSVLEDLATFDNNNRQLIAEDFNNGEGKSLTFEYLHHHLIALQEDCCDIIDNNATEIDNLTAIMKALSITTISFYSDMVVFDYCLNDEVSDQLLVVHMDRDNNLSILWES